MNTLSKVSSEYQTLTKELRNVVEELHRQRREALDAIETLEMDSIDTAATQGRADGLQAAIRGLEALSDRQTKRVMGGAA